MQAEHPRSHASPWTPPREDRAHRELSVDSGAGAVVMATGIVSIGLSMDGQALLSDIWMVATAAAWVLLAALAAARAKRDREWRHAAVRSPASLTAVAGTAVLGARLETAGFAAVSLILLAVAALICVRLAVAIVRAWPLPSSGSSFMATVSLESLAGLAALEAGAGRPTWLIYPALVLCALGLALYLVVSARFDPRELLRGLGDHWVAGGALAISALTLGLISRAVLRQAALHHLGRPVADLSAVIWILSALWLPVMLAGELVAPRLRYNVRRWSTLFPVGMYAVSGFEVAHVSWLAFGGSFARVLIWVAMGLWLVLAAGIGRRPRSALAAS